MTLRRNAVVHFICALLLLIAQQGALSHQIWHAANSAAHSDAAPDTNNPEPKKTSLCDLHTALGAVLGALNGAPHGSQVDAFEQLRFAAAAPAEPRLVSLAPASRGPPALPLKT